jgi:hypothetical protein
MTTDNNEREIDTEPTNVVPERDAEVTRADRERALEMLSTWRGEFATKLCQKWAADGETYPDGTTQHDLELELETAAQAIANARAEGRAELDSVRADNDGWRSLALRAAQFTYDAQVVNEEDLECLATGLYGDLKAALDATEQGGYLVDKLRTKCESLELELEAAQQTRDQSLAREARHLELIRELAAAGAALLESEHDCYEMGPSAEQEAAEARLRPALARARAHLKEFGRG